MMLKRRRKAEFQAEESLSDSDRGGSRDTADTWLPGYTNVPFKDYLKFALYCMLLAVPLYAITVSIIRQDWIMVFVDALLVPVGFIHGLLLLLGYLN
jgi:hypothetical protein